MVDLQGNQKAIWELAVRYNASSYFVKRKASKVLKRV